MLSDHIYNTIISMNKFFLDGQGLKQFNFGYRGSVGVILISFIYSLRDVMVFVL